MKTICITIRDFEDIRSELENVLANMSSRLIPEELLYLSFD